MSVLPTVRQILQGLNPVKSPEFLRFDQVLACWLVAIALLLQGCISQPPQTNFILAFEAPIAEIPVEVTSSVLPDLTAPSFLVVDLDSASTLIASDSDKLRYPASALKLLTAMTILDQMPATDKISLSEIDLTTSPGIKNELSWRVNEIVTVENLIASLLIHSDNLSAQILANHYPGGLSQLKLDMAKLAKNLHLSNQLQIQNPVGLDAPGQLLTTRDLVSLARAALKLPLIKSLVATKQLTLTTQQHEISINHLLTNTNELLFSDQNVYGVKTGTTDLAGEVLVTLVDVQDHPVLIGVMGSSERFRDTQIIINWLKLHYRWQSWSEVAYNKSLN